MRFLRQSTSAVYCSSAFIDKTDGCTGKTALGSQTGRITKVGVAGAAFTPSSWTHEYGGAYLVGISAAHSDTLGQLRIAFYDPTTHQGVEDYFTVLPQEVFDALIAGTTVEVAAVPAPTGGVIKALMWIFAISRNKRTSTNAIEKLKKDDGSTDLASAPVSSDGTTTTRDEWS